MNIPQFRRTILAWHKHNRRDMPWRRTHDPYKILVSEIMLQQTQVARVFPKYEEFLRAFPNVEALARAPETKLLRVWAGLGYWRRAKYLQATARIILKEYAGKFPPEIASLEQLPGLGPYTARALACFAFGNNEPFIDTNIRRVYLHFFFPRKKNVPDKKILTIAAKAIPAANSREWHYALFDYGAIVLKDKSINKQSSHYHTQSEFARSFRSFRTLVVKYLLTRPTGRARKQSVRRMLTASLRRKKSIYTTPAILTALAKDGLIQETERYYRL